MVAFCQELVAARPPALPALPLHLHRCPGCQALGIFLGMLSASSPRTSMDTALPLNRLQMKPLARSSPGADISFEREQIPLDACAPFPLPHPSAPPPVHPSMHPPAGKALALCLTPIPLPG